MIDDARKAEQIRRTRGLLLGVALGGTVGSYGGTIPGSSEPLRATTATQLACFTAEGLIQCHLRSRMREIMSPPNIWVWFALVRWARGQHLPISSPILQELDESHLEIGWLRRVPILREHRGYAPATVAAMRANRMGTRAKPVTTSHGAQALVRTLPLAAFSAAAASRDIYEIAADTAAVTHGDPKGYLAAAEGTVLATEFATATDPQTAVSCALMELSFSEDRKPHLDRYADAASDAVNNPADPTVLKRYGSDRSSHAVLSAALYAATSFPEYDQVCNALRFASAGADRGSVAAVTGALLGAMHGADALPVDLVSRLELAWVADTLARDIVTEVVDKPDEAYDCSEPRWHERYFG